MDRSHDAPKAESGAVNPFDFGPARPTEFVGRWPLVNELADQLAAGQASYGIIGGRRFGKTSILNVLRHTLWETHGAGSARPVLPLLLDPTLYSFKSPEHFFAILLQQVLRRTDDRSPDPYDELAYTRISLNGTQMANLAARNPPAIISASDFAEAMNIILDRLETSHGPRRLVVLLDEFDSLLDYVWHQDLFAQLRASIVSGDLQMRLRLVLAGSHRFLDEASRRGSPLWNMLQLRYLSALDEASTRELSARAGGLAEAVQQAVWQQSGGHPFIASYLLHHLWRAGSDQVTEGTVADLAEQFMQLEAAHLDGWSKAIGLSGLQIYGLFVDAPGWIARKDLVKEVNDPKVPTSRALTALGYHGLLVPSPTWNQYRRGGDLFCNWYLVELPRLIDELTSKASAPSPQFWIQLITQGPLQSIFDQRGQQVETQYNAARDIKPGG